MSRRGTIQLSIPAGRRVAPQPGIRIHRTRAAADTVHPASLPARSRIENAVLDHADLVNAQTAIDTVLRATQRRPTTAERIRTALDVRSRHRHRPLLIEVLAEVHVGVQSPLERRYLRDVERAHRLPAASRNRQERTADGGHQYRDVRYRRWSTVVELDGREAHPADRAFRDHRRDNAATVAGDVVLRYGWHDVVRGPCLIAAQVAAVLRARGWPSTAFPCGPACAVQRAA